MISDRISINPNVCHGQACIKGTRIPVHLILGFLASGDTFDDIIEDYPGLSKKDILACLEYASILALEELSPIEVLAV
ncbi:MAG: DUF433 domain-containing protein [bacterium]